VPHETIAIGDVEIVALLDVDVSDEPIADAFPGAPPDAILAGKGRYPNVYGADDVWRLRVRVWLIRHPGGLLLLDTGVGPETSPAMDWCPEPGSAPTALAEIASRPLAKRSRRAVANRRPRVRSLACLRVRGARTGRVATCTAPTLSRTVELAACLLVSPRLLSAKLGPGPEPP